MSAATLTSRRQSVFQIKRWLARHPILSYFAIAFGGTWGMLAVPVLSQNGVGLLPFKVPEIVMMVLFVLATLAGPTLGAIIMTAVAAGRPGLRAFFRRYVQVRVGLRWYLVVLLGYPLVNLLAAGAYSGVAPFEVALARWPLFFTSYLPAVLASMIMPALAEEPGWRGFALPQLQRSYGPLLGSLILGALHMSWHLPVFFITEGIMAMAPFNAGDFGYQILTSMVLTVIWAWVFNNVRGSIFMALVLHGTNNGVGALVDGWGLQAAAPGVSMYVDVLYAACALLIVVSTRGRLSYTPGLALPNPATPVSADQPAPRA